MGRVKMSRHTANQCKARGHEWYDYHICVSCPDGNLDKDGYVVDHHYIHNMVVELFKTTTGSCEQLANLLGRGIEDFLRVKGVHVTDLYVKLTPVTAGRDKNKAFIEYSKTGVFI